MLEFTLGFCHLRLGYRTLFLGKSFPLCVVVTGFRGDESIHPGRVSPIRVNEDGELGALGHLGGYRGSNSFSGGGTWGAC